MSIRIGLTTTELVATFAIDPLDSAAGDLLEVASARASEVVNAIAIGMTSPLVRKAADVFEPLNRPKAASLVGTSRRFDGPTAAMLSALAAYCGASERRQDASLVASALISGEMSDSSPRGVLEAVAVGLEINARLGQAFSSSLDERGWREGVLDVIGCAACAARLLGLNQDEATYALSAAATQAAGLRIHHNSPIAGIDIGRAAANGV